MRTAMPCPVGRPGVCHPLLTSTDPTGFIYPTYRATSTETQRDKPSSKGPHQEVAYVSSAAGGSVSTLSFENSHPDHGSPPMRRGGGIRNRVRGFSRTSRRNLLRHLASINRSAFSAFRGRIIFVTLTYPKQYPEGPRTLQETPQSARKRLQRSMGPSPLSGGLVYSRRRMALSSALVRRTVFRTDRQAAPLHLLFLVRSYGEGFRKEHLRAGTRVEAVKKWKQATSYVELHGQARGVPKALETGRIWGVWNEDLLPVRWETVEVSLSDAFRIRRIYRKLAKSKGIGSLHSITVFVRHENVVRLLEFLGYSLE